MLSGIYKIENTFNGKIYIGSSSEIPIRKYNHFNQLRHNKHPNQHLQSAYNKYGKDFFSFSILEKISDINQLINREQYWIDLALSEESNIYNKTQCANPLRGKEVTKETRDKIRNTLRSKGIIPPSRKDIGYGFCKLICKNSHYKTSSVCKICMRTNMKNFKMRHK